MKIDINLPENWSELSQKQLRLVFSYLSSDVYSIHQCKLLLAFRLGGIKFYGVHDEGALVRINGIFIILDQEDLLAIAHQLDFIEEDPQIPVRLYELKHRKAVHPLLRDLTFAQWLAIENLYFGFLENKDINMLNEILSILYPKKGLFNRFIKTFKDKDFNYCHINAIKWLSSFKKYLSRRYKEIYRNIDSSIEGQGAVAQMNIMESMNAQIRALTKGDITKNEAVLNMDLHSALTELDALALEARKLNESMKKK